MEFDLAFINKSELNLPSCCNWSCFHWTLQPRSRKKETTLRSERRNVICLTHFLTRHGLISEPLTSLSPSGKNRSRENIPSSYSDHDSRRGIHSSGIVPSVLGRSGETFADQSNPHFGQRPWKNQTGLGTLVLDLQQLIVSIEKTNRVKIPKKHPMINRDDSYNLINRGPLRSPIAQFHLGGAVSWFCQGIKSLCCFKIIFFRSTRVQCLMSLLLVWLSLESSVSSCGTSSLHLFNTRGGATGRSHTTSPGPRRPRRRRWPILWRTRHWVPLSSPAAVPRECG